MCGSCGGTEVSFVPRFEARGRERPSHSQPKGHIMSHLLYRIGNFAGRHPWRVIAALGRRGDRRRSCSTPPSAVQSNDELQPARLRVRNAPPTPSRTASRSRPCTPRNVIFHSDDGLTAPADPGGGRRRPSSKLADGRTSIAVTSPYDPRGPTVSDDGQTAFATVGFDEREGRRRRVRRRREGRPGPSATPASRSSTTAASATPRPRPAATAR